MQNTALVAARPVGRGWLALGAAPGTHPLALVKPARRSSGRTMVGGVLRRASSRSAHRYEVNQMLDHVPAMVYSYMVHENNENPRP